MIDFLAGKIGAALVALTLVGALLMTAGSFERGSERSELEAVTDVISNTLMEVDGLRAEARLALPLPKSNFPFELTISGSWEGTQTIRISAQARERVERWLLLASEVNGGEFELKATSPTSITVHKHGSITLEVG